MSSASSPSKCAMKYDHILNMLFLNNNILEHINTINCVKLGIWILQTIPMLNWMSLIHGWDRFEWAQHGYVRQDNFLMNNSSFFSQQIFGLDILK